MGENPHLLDFQIPASSAYMDRPFITATSNSFEPIPIGTWSQLPLLSPMSQPVLFASSAKQQQVKLTGRNSVFTIEKSRKISIFMENSLDAVYQINSTAL